MVSRPGACYRADGSGAEMMDYRWLLAGERIRWQGAPPPDLLLLRPQDALLIPFSLFWGGFVIFWNISVWSMHAPGFFQLWGLPFLAIGLYMIVGRFVHDCWLRRRTDYFVTDRRIVVTRGSTMKSLALQSLPGLDFSERPDGTGTIRFGAAASILGNRSFSTWVPSLDPVPQFLCIPDARSVYQLIEKLRA